MPNFSETQFLTYVLAIVGLILIIKGGDIFVDAAVWVAKVLKIPDIIIGATLVSVCTTLPESVISITSSAKNIPDIALGNAMGSIIFNTGIILGVMFFIATPLISDKKNYRFNGILLVSLLALLIPCVFLFGGITRIVGAVLLVFLILYMIRNVKHAFSSKREQSHTDEHVDKSRRAALKNISFIILGAAAIVLGSNMLIDSAEKIALSFGVSKTILGLTLAAIGSSLPELVTSISAIIKKAHNISVGNIIGADLLNVMLVTGGASFVNDIKIGEGYPVSLNSALFQIASAVIITGTAVLFGFTNRHSFKRWNGFVLVALYSVFMYFSFKYFA